MASNTQTLHIHDLQGHQVPAAQQLKESCSLFVHSGSMYSSVEPLRGVVFSPLVTAVNVKAPTFNSSCLLAVCPLPWPASAALTGLFCPTGVTDSSYLMANFIQCRLKTTSSLTGHSDSPSHKKSALWTNGMRIMWKGPFYPHRLFLLHGMCTVYTSHLRVMEGKKGSKK